MLWSVTPFPQELLLMIWSLAQSLIASNLSNSAICENELHGLPQILRARWESPQMSLSPVGRPELAASLCPPKGYSDCSWQGY